MSDADRVSLIYAKEPSYGAALPAPTPPAFVPGDSLETSQFEIQDNCLQRIEAPAQNEIQVIDVGNQTDGTFALYADSAGLATPNPHRDTTVDILQSTDLFFLKLALAFLYDATEDDFIVSGTPHSETLVKAPFTVEFTGTLAGRPLPLMYVDPDSTLNPGVVPAQPVTRTQVGRPAPGTAITEEVHKLTLETSSVGNFFLRLIHRETGEEQLTTALTRLSDTAASLAALSAIYPSGLSVEAEVLENEWRVTITYGGELAGLQYWVPEFVYENPILFSLAQKEEIRLAIGTGNPPEDELPECITVGGLLQMEGWENDENNGIFTVASVDADTVCFEEDTLVNETPSGLITLTCGTMSEEVPNAIVKALRFRRENLAESAIMRDSAELQKDSLVVDTIRTATNVSGSVGVEFSQDSFDDFLAAIMGNNEWEDEAPFIGGSGEVTEGNKVTLAVLTWILGSFVGKWVLITGFNEPENNGIFQVIEEDSVNKWVRVAGSLTNTEVDPPIFPTVIVQLLEHVAYSPQIPSFAIQRIHHDISPVKYTNLIGMCLNVFELRVPADGIITGGLSFIGQRELPGSDILGGVELPSLNTTPIMSGAEFVSSVLLDFVAVPCIEFQIRFNRNLRVRRNIGDILTLEPGIGKFSVEGVFRAYFADHTLMNKCRDNDTMSLSLVLKSESNYYVFHFPKCRMTLLRTNVVGQNTPVVADGSFKSVLDPSAGISAQIARYVAEE